MALAKPLILDGMDKVQAGKLLKLKERIAEHFSAENWTDVGLLIGNPDIIHGHPRLLRSLSWHDDDYGANVVETIRRIEAIDPKAVGIVEDYLAKKYPEESEYISPQPAERKISFAPQVFKVPTVPLQPDLISVMMPFDGSFAPVYDAIKFACDHQKMRCLRADNVWNHSTIIQDIFELIFKARIVVIDFSHKNPNVNYEAGIAHTLGKDVIPISQSMDDIPFDIRHHRVLTYLNNGEGLGKMKYSLAAKIASYQKADRGI